MAKVLVDDGGFVTLNSVPVAFVVRGSLSEIVTGQSAQAIGDATSQDDRTLRRFEIDIERMADSTDTSGGLFAVPLTTTAQYDDQNGETLFAGPVVVTRVSNIQRVGDYERQTLTCRSHGTPTTVPVAF